MEKVELLSPAGDLKGLKRAVFCGANAVYFGAKNFNARASAENFADLKTAVAFCHMYGVKVYLTLNTLVDNEQITDLLTTVKDAIDAGVDAFIVQDFGVVNILKNCFVGVEIHASTQMAINNYLGANMAKNMGIKRVVLSRETSLEDIKLIKQKSNLDIEYFIQGALCVCFSGNCYMSSYLFGKSGNKGECKQPCRLPIKAYLDNKQIGSGYLLSAKDICMANSLQSLIDAGVNSFKIEGRLRRPSYIAGTTSIYRNIIDNGFNVAESDIQTLKKLFNRGDYTRGYFDGNGRIVDSTVQGHKGVKIGEVIDVIIGKRFNTLVIKSSHNITKGDTIKFIKNDKEVGVITAVDISNSNGSYIITTTSKIPIKSQAYLIVDSGLENELLNIDKKLPVNFNLIANAGNKLCLKYSFNNNEVSGEVFGDVLQPAQNQPLTLLDAQNQLSKLKNTNFYLNNFQFLSNGAFATKKQLNDIRNLAIEKIFNSFILNKNTQINYNYINSVLGVKNNKNNNQISYEISDSFNSNKDILIVRPKNYLSFDYSKITHKNAYLYVPSYLTTKDITAIEKILNNNPSLGIYSDNIAFAKYKNKRTILGAKLNIKNVFALKELMHNYVNYVFVSPEVNDKEFNMLKCYSNVPIIKTSFDGFDLMTLVHCPIKLLFNNKCENCKYQENIIYKFENGKTFKIVRHKIVSCTFYLQELKK